MIFFAKNALYVPLFGNTFEDKLPKAYSRISRNYIPFTLYQEKTFNRCKLGTSKIVGNYLRALEREGFLKSVKGEKKNYLSIID